MNCPECEKTGTKPNRIYEDGMSTTLIGWSRYQDAEGRWHGHDPNRKRLGYRCSNGHSWEQVTGDTCWCGWRSIWAVGHLVQSEGLERP